MVANKEVTSTPIAVTLSEKDKTNRRDQMKFKNGDISLGEAIKRNGGRLAMSKMKALFDTSW